MIQVRKAKQTLVNRKTNMEKINIEPVVSLDIFYKYKRDYIDKN